MAARRLIILMVLLLAISTLAAALLPAPETGEEDRTRGETTPRESSRTGPPTAGSPDAGKGGRLLRILDTAPRPPQTVSVRVGDQLTLLVTSRFADLVEIPAFGLIKAVAPAAPARFELLLERAGVFPVRTHEGGLLAGRVCATPAKLSPRARRGRSPARACAPRDRREREADSRSAPQP